MHSSGPPVSPKKRLEYKSMDRDTRSLRGIPIPIFNVKEKDTFAKSIAESHRSSSGSISLASAAEINHTPVAEPPADSQLAAVHAAQRACIEDRPRTPSKKNRYKDLGLGRSPSREGRKSRDGRVISSPSHLSSTYRSSSRTTSSSTLRSTSSSMPIESGHSKEHMMRLQYFQPGVAMVTSARGSGIHFLPQVFRIPEVDISDNSMIRFTRDGAGIDLGTKHCTITDELFLCPDGRDPTSRNPYSISVELFVRLLFIPLISSLTFVSTVPGTSS